MISNTCFRFALSLLITVLALADPLRAQITAPVSSDTSGTAIRVTLLGTGSPVPALDRFGSATLVEAGTETLLFDAGRGVAQRLWQTRVPLSRVGTVFFTHLHSDHTVGLPDLWLTGWIPAPYGNRSASLSVRGPTGTRAMTDGLTQAFAWDLDRRSRGEGIPVAGAVFDAQDVKPGIVLERNGVRVTAFLVDHGALLEPAYGYRVDYAGHSVVISGDTRPNENLVKAATGADVLVHEVIAAPSALLEQSQPARRIAALHTLPEDAGRVFARAKPRLAVYSHIVLLRLDPKIPAPELSDLIAQTRKTYDGRVEVGEDLMVIEIGAEVRVRRGAPPVRAGG